MKRQALKVKRVYEKPGPEDGFRVLVDRLWPRGVKKEEAKVDLWLKEIGPSDDLRKWFNHDPERCSEFKGRYFRELEGKEELLRQIEDRIREGPVTLVYAAKFEECNNATAIRDYIGMRSGKRR